VFAVSDLLTTESCEVDTASDGVAGLERALRQEFDLIILDIMLPRKNGFEVYPELRQPGRDVAVLILTAKSQVVDRAQPCSQAIRVLQRRRQ
jgi:DNA-binding response OmpR family regulator